MKFSAKVHFAISGFSVFSVLNKPDSHLTRSTRSRK